MFVSAAGAAKAPGQLTRVYWTGDETLTASSYDYAKRIQLTYKFSVHWSASWEWDPKLKLMRPQTGGSISGTASRISGADGSVLCSGPVTGQSGVPAVSIDKLGKVTFEAAAIPGWAGGGDLATCYGGLVPPIGVGDVSRQRTEFKATTTLSSLLNGSASASDSDGFSTDSTYQTQVCIAGCIKHSAATDGGYTAISPSKPVVNPNDPKYTIRAKLTWSSKVSTGTGPGTYVALGDSYSSGEGAGDYFAGTADLVNACHRSHLAWPVLVANQLGYKEFDGKPGKESEFGACSGAIVDDLDNFSTGVYTDAQYKVKNLDEPPQREHLQLGNIKLVTLSFGGNDLGFGDVVSDCVADGVMKQLHDDAATLNAYTQFFARLVGQLPAEQRVEPKNDQSTTCQAQHGAAAKAELPKLIPRLIKAYREVADLAPDAKVLVVGYPNFFPATLSTPYCANAVQRSDVIWASGLITDFDAAVKSAVASAGRSNLEYVAPSPSWAGHTICDRDTWFVTPEIIKGAIIGAAGKEADREAKMYWANVIGLPALIRNMKALFYEPGLTTSQYFHPNVAGQQALAAAVASHAQ